MSQDQNDPIDRTGERRNAITDKHKRTPEIGSKWTDYVPTWARVGIPALTVFISFGGFALGFGEGKGEAAERVNSLSVRTDRLERLRDIDREAAYQLKGEIADLRGDVRAIARALRVPLAPHSDDKTQDGAP